MQKKNSMRKIYYTQKHAHGNQTDYELKIDEHNKMKFI